MMKNDIVGDIMAVNFSSIVSAQIRTFDFSPKNINKIIKSSKTYIDPN